MNILTDILSLIRRGVYADKAGVNDVLVLGVNEEPDMTGVASPIPYKSVKLIKVKDFKIAASNCEYKNSPTVPASGTGQVYQKTDIDATTQACTVFFRSLKSMSSNLTLALSSDNDYLELTTEGEPNLASNVGSGAGLWKDKNGETLRFKSIVQGNNITVGASTNEITLSVPKGGGLSLTTLNSSGAATLVSGVLNIPQYGGGSSYVLPAATATTLGGVELFSNTVQLEAAEAVSTIKDRTYGLQFNSSGQAVVNVPWATSGGGSMSSFTVDGDSGSPQTVSNGDTVTIEGGTAIDTVGTGGPKIVVNWNKGAALGYTKYVALLSQFAGNAPTQIILENNTGRTLTWVHATPGQFRGTWDVDLVDLDKCTFTIAQHFKSGPRGANISATTLQNLLVQSTSDGANTLADSILDNTTIEIKIYN